MNHYNPVREITIYVHPRKITRKGRRVDGWQAGFQPLRGGVTSEDKEEAIRQMDGILRREGMILVEIVEER